jgi:hypothetical protein
MAVPLPSNTLPMMTGTGPFGPIEMGGMFTVMKVREDLAPSDYRDPGWHKHPQGTVAYEAGVAAASAPKKQPGSGEAPSMDMQMPGMKMPMQPGGDGHQHNH